MDVNKLIAHIEQGWMIGHSNRLGLSDDLKGELRSLRAAVAQYETGGK